MHIVVFLFLAILLAAVRLSGVTLYGWTGYLAIMFATLFVGSGLHHFIWRRPRGTAATYYRNGPPA